LADTLLAWANEQHRVGLHVRLQRSGGGVPTLFVHQPL